MRTCTLFIALTMIFLLHSVTAQVSYKDKVAVIGDSITADDGYLRELRKNCPGMEFHNFGISGESSSKILARVRRTGTDLGKKICGLEDYGTIIVLAGINNIDNPQRVMSDLSRIYAMAKSASHPIRVIALTLTPWSGYGTWTVEKQRNTAIVNKFILSYPANVDIAVDIYSALADPSNPWALRSDFHISGDKLHPRGKGQEMIGWTVFKEAFEPFLAASAFRNLKTQPN